MDAIAGTPEYQSVSKKPVKDAVLLGVTFLCVFTSFHALQNLQSSLHQDEGLGMASLAAMYGTSFVTSLFTPAIVFNIGIKATLLLGCLLHLIYVACNILPSWFTLIPGSVLLGLGTCPLWTAANTYISALARVRVEADIAAVPKKVTTVHAAFSHLNGIFHSMFMGGNLFGNLLSSLILFQSTRHELPTSSYLQEGRSCGAEYCLLSGTGHKLTSPQPQIVYIMLGVFMAFDVAGMIITCKFTANLNQPHYTGWELCRKIRSYWQAFCQPKIFMLIPLFASRGMNFSIHVGLLTEAYVSCALGIHWVGYVMAAVALSTMISSFLLGYAARFTGRKFLYVFAFMVDFSILALLRFWHPHSASIAVFFCIAALIGLVDGIWTVQCNALVAVLFPALVDSAFSVSGTWHSVTMAVSFILAKYMCPTLRLYLAMGLLACAMVGYVAVEIFHKRSLISFDQGQDHQYMLVQQSSGAFDGDEDDDVVEFGVEETSFGRAVTAVREEDGVELLERQNVTKETSGDVR